MLKKSQSLRWIVAGFVFTVMEQVAGAVGYELIPGPKWQTSLILGVIFAGAFVARLLAAKED